MEKHGKADLFGWLRDSTIWELGHELTREMPVHPNHPPFFFTMVKRHGDSYREEGYSAASDMITMSGHHGTHMDALGHVSVNGHLHSGAIADDAQRGLKGLTSDDIGEQLPVLTRAVLIDIPRLIGKDELEPGYLITVDQVEAALAEDGLVVGEGDVVLFRSGWGGVRWSRGVAGIYPPRGQPGPGEDVAKWLSARKVRAVGSDTMSFESVTENQNRMPVHSELLFHAGIPIMEMLALEEIAAAGVHEFLFAALPLRIRGATGSPIRPIAIS